MDTKTHAKLQAYVAKCANQIGLSNWNISVQQSYLENDQAWAATRINPMYKEALMAFNQRSLQLDRSQIRRITAHELSHILLEPLHDTAKMNSMTIHDKSSHFYLIESTVEDVGRSLARSLPLPPMSIVKSIAKTNK